MPRTYTFEIDDVPAVVPKATDEPNPFLTMVKELAADRNHSRTFLLWGVGNEVPAGVKREDALSVDPKRNKELGAVISLLNDAGNALNPPVTVRKSKVQVYGNAKNRSQITDLQLKVWAVDKQQRPRKDKTGADTTPTTDTTTGTETPTANEAGSKA